MLSFLRSLRCTKNDDPPKPRQRQANAVFNGPETETPKLRIWHVGDTRFGLQANGAGTSPAINVLVDTLVAWDGRSDIDIVWPHELGMTQYDLAGPSNP